jgi:hypothetical protein
MSKCRKNSDGQSQRSKRGQSAEEQHQHHDLRVEPCVMIVRLIVDVIALSMISCVFTIFR